MAPSRPWRSISVALLLGTSACGSVQADPGPGEQQGDPPNQPAEPGDEDDEPGGSTEEPAPLLPGDTVINGIDPGSAQGRARFAQLTAEVERMGALSAGELAREYPMQHAASLGYSPGQAEFMDLIQASSLALDSSELGVLEQNGFVISSRQQFPNFMRGYAAIYMEDLPVYVSADAILDALHRSYDQILISLEYAALMPALEEMLRRMFERIPSIEASDQSKADLGLYLDVARCLLSPADHVPRSDEARSLLQKARAARGTASVTLFGAPREEDFSQFRPRGHYTEEPLSNYFRAMMWLGRVDFRLIETRSDGTVVFRRPQYDAMLALHELMDERSTELWSSVDNVVRAFVGESDSMTVPEVASLISDLGGLGAAREASDQAVVQAINEGGYGEQQIASYLITNATGERLPLNRSFLVFGQRYVADSHVLSEAVHARVPGRMMPNPLDAAFAALGNNQALALDAAELERYPGLPGALGAMRYLIDSHDESYWDANLYNLWSGALRALSPAPDSRDPADAGLPKVAGTEAWGRRLLNAQLGSWAQLRHDTLLYAKQSYTDGALCEFPDAYVEPNPEFFRALVRFAERGAELVSALPADSYLITPLQGYFSSFAATVGTLAQMAEQQRTGEPFSAAQLAFINDAVRVDMESAGCVTTEVPNGWYASLFFDREKAIEQDLTIADVHTQPTDEGGNPVGKVLHVGTAFPRLMTVTIDTCVGPRAYAGMAYSYQELITEGFLRLTDEEWTARVSRGEISEVTWLRSLIAP